ncbi:MAG TPA: hypothetical protein VFB77_16440 [Acidimicrobiales bacterium]|nr:hypothetical protein [Acidimicrobiales bacterium]
MRRTVRRTAALAAAVFALFVAASCSGGGGDPSAASPSTTATASPSPTATVPVTAPGTELDLGQPASILLEQGGGSGVVAVSIVSITPGSPDEAVKLQFATGEPFYVTMLIQNTAAPPELGSYVPELIGLQDDGNLSSTVNEPPGFEPCRDNGPASLAVGASFLTCEAFVADAGTRVTAVGFVSGPDADPIVWS